MLNHSKLSRVLFGKYQRILERRSYQAKGIQFVLITSLIQMAAMRLP